VAHARREAPNECCGLLAGRDGLVARQFAIASDRKSPIRYFMNPKEQVSALRAIRESGLDMLAIYHSHPTSDAWPSAHDQEMALFPALKPGEPPAPCYPGCAYVIISLVDSDRPTLRAFELAGTDFAEVPLEIVNG